MTPLQNTHVERFLHASVLAAVLVLLLLPAAVLASGPTASPTPVPTPSPSPSPSPAPTPEPQLSVSTSQNVIVVTAPSPEPKQEPVSFFKTDDRDTAKPGQILTYRIVIQNPNENDLTEVRIVDHVPPYLTPLSTNPEARSDAKSRTITWENQTISAKSEITFAFRARVAPDSPDGFLLQNVADVNGPGVRASVTDTTQVVAPRVAAAVAPKPQPVPVTAKTGTPLDVLSFILSLSGSIATAGTLLVRRFV